MDYAQLDKKAFPVIILTWIIKGEGSFLQSSNQGV